MRTGVGAEEAKRLVEAGIQGILARSPEDRNRRAIVARGSALQRESDIAAAIELALLLGAKTQILPVSDDPCDGVDVAARNEAGDQWLHVSTISTDSRTLHLIPVSAAKTQTAGVRLSWALTEYAPDGDYVGSGLIAIGQTEDEFEIDPVRLILEFLGEVPVSPGPEDTSAQRTQRPADDDDPRP